MDVKKVYKLDDLRNLPVGSVINLSINDNEFVSNLTGILAERSDGAYTFTTATEERDLIEYKYTEPEMVISEGKINVNHRYNSFRIISRGNESYRTKAQMLINAGLLKPKNKTNPINQREYTEDDLLIDCQRLIDDVIGKNNGAIDDMFMPNESYSESIDMEPLESKVKDAGQIRANNSRGRKDGHLSDMTFDRYKETVMDNQKPNNTELEKLEYQLKQAIDPRVQNYELANKLKDKIKAIREEK
jgi:hypothetical protein